MGWDAVLLHIRRPVGEGGLSNMRVELVAYTTYNFASF